MRFPKTFISPVIDKVKDRPTKEAFAELIRILDEQHKNIFVDLQKLSAGIPGYGDMFKATYDTDDDDIVDKAETVDDGAGNVSSAADVKDAVDKKHTAGTDSALAALGTKDPPIDADKAVYRDSTDSDSLVTSTWTQIKAFLKTYFDGLYEVIGAVADHLIAFNHALLHTQGTDTTLGTQTEDLDMGGYKVTEMDDATEAMDAVPYRQLLNSLNFVINYFFGSSNVMAQTYTAGADFLAQTPSSTPETLSDIYFKSEVADTPTPFTIKNGTEFIIHFNAKVSTITGVKRVKLSAGLWYTDSDGVSGATQIGADTSLCPENIETTMALQRLWGVVAGEVVVPAGKRLWVKVIATCTGASGNYPEISVEYGDIHDHLSFAVAGGVLANFVQKSGGIMTGPFGQVYATPEIYQTHTDGTKLRWYTDATGWHLMLKATVAGGTTSMGGAAINRASTNSPGSYTYMDANIPATAAGTLTHVDLYCFTNLGNYKIKVFRITGSDVIFVGESEAFAVTAGLNSKDLGTPVPGVQIGDIIGYSADHATARIDREATGGTSNYYITAGGDVTGDTVIGDWTGPIAGWISSCRGTITTAGAETEHEIMRVKENAGEGTKFKGELGPEGTAFCGAPMTTAEAAAVVLSASQQFVYMNTDTSTTHLREGESVNIDLADIPDSRLAQLSTANKVALSALTLLSTLANKATPVDADLVLSGDSAASFALKQSTWTQVKAFLKTYWDTIFQTLANLSTDYKLGISETLYVCQHAIRDAINSAINAAVLSLQVSPTTLDDCEATTGWSTDANGTLALSDIYAEGSHGISCAKTGTGAYFTDFDKTISSVDLTHKYVNLSLYIADATQLAKMLYVYAYIGTGGAADAYVAWYQLADLSVGWNTIKIDYLNPATIIGSPDITDIDFIRLRLTADDPSYVWAADQMVMDWWRSAISFEVQSNKGIADGYAELDGDGVVPIAQIHSDIRVKGYCTVASDGASHVGYNVSSVTDTGVGDSTVVWDDDMAGTAYTCVTSSGTDSMCGQGTRATGSTQIRCYRHDGLAADRTRSIAVFEV